VHFEIIGNDAPKRRRLETDAELDFYCIGESTWRPLSLQGVAMQPPRNRSMQGGLAAVHFGISGR
jgi:hypothetical protein